jgi:hypothetical protein
MKNIKYEKFLKEFSNDEITILEAIYKNSIQVTSFNGLISSINRYTKMPKVKTEVVLNSIENKGYMKLSEYDSGLTYKGKNKVLEMFGDD